MVVVNPSRVDCSYSTRFGRACGDFARRVVRSPLVSGSLFGGAMLLSANVAVAQVPADSLVLEGDFIRTGVSNNGTLGVGGNISPGFIFDATGTRTFNPANDYLTPGSPWEGFSIRYDGSGVITNNNAGGPVQIGPATAPVVVGSGVSGYDNSVSWTGSIAGVLTVTHLYGLNNNAQRVEIKTTITALTDLTGVRFARFIDPDSGGTSSINTRGNAMLGLAPEDWVNSESETNGATLGLYSNSAVAHNTGITLPWSNDPNVYIAGTGDATGDRAIGLGFDVGALLNGQSIDLIYWYAVAASADDFDFGGGLIDKAKTFNQIAIAAYLDGESSNANLDFQDLLTELRSLDDPELLAALDAIDGALYGTLPAANFQHTSYYLSQIASRLRNKLVPYGSPLYDEFASVDPATSSRAAEMKRREIALVSYAAGDRAATDAEGAGDCDAGCSSCEALPCCGCSAWSGWIAGYGLGGDAQGDGNADGFTYGLGGTQVGLERQVSDTTALGAWGNFAWSNVRGDVLDENADIENYHFGAHLTWLNDDDYWIAIGGAGYDHYDVRRQTNILAPVAAEGTMDGWQANAYLERGRTLCASGWNVQPYAALQYIYLRQNDLVETGAGVLNLDVEDLDAHSLRGILGGRFSKTVCTKNGRMLTPEFRAAWMHEFLDTNQVVNAGLAGIGGAGFAVRGLDLGRDWATLGAGFNLHMTDAVRLFAGYDVQLNSNQTFHIGSGGVEFVW